MSQPTSVFADGILEASVHHGVARITLAQSGGDGKPVASGQLVIPVVQLPSFANGVLALLKQIDAKVKQAQGQQAQGQPAQAQPAPPQPAEAQPAAAAVEMPASFRFSG
jgi:hypothetical protein